MKFFDKNLADRLPTIVFEDNIGEMEGILVERFGEDYTDDDIINILKKAVNSKNIKKEAVIKEIKNGFSIYNYIFIKGDTLNLNQYACKESDYMFMPVMEGFINLEDDTYTVYTEMLCNVDENSPYTTKRDQQKDVSAIYIVILCLTYALAFDDINKGKIFGGPFKYIPGK